MTTAADDQDVEAIRAVVADTEALQSDADGFAGLLTENVALVNFGGRRVLGRDNVRQAMRQALETPSARVYTKTEVVDVPDVRAGQGAGQLADRAGTDNPDRGLSHPPGGPQPDAGCQSSIGGLLSCERGRHGRRETKDEQIA
jgi:hypothetical protein